MKKILVVAILLFSGSFMMAQKCGFKYGSNEADSIKCLEEISSFRIFYEQKNYHDALTPWKYIVDNCPCSWNGVFSYAQTMFDQLIKKEKDSVKKEEYIDLLLHSYEVRHLYHPDKYTEGNGLGFKAFNIMRYRNKEYEQAYNWFVQSIELEKENTQPSIWDIYFKTAELMVKIKQDTTIIIEAYERATDYIDLAIIEAYKNYEQQLPNFENLNEAYEAQQINKIEYDKKLKNLSADTTRQMKLIENYKKTLSNIEGTFSPYAPCNVLEAVYSKKLENNRENIPVLKKMVLTLSKGNCITTPIFKEALDIVHKAEPGAQSAFLMGNLSLRNGETDKAIEYFNQAIKLFETNEQKADAYYMLGLANQLKQNYSEARSNALEVIKVHPNSGKAYILIGDLYASSGSRCSGDDMIPYSYNWAAADKYSKAAAVDRSVAEEAHGKRAKLKFPSNNDFFVRGLKVGESYRIGCWIQETTTIR